MSAEERALLNRLGTTAKHGSAEVRRAILRVLADSRAHCGDMSRHVAYTGVIEEIEAHARAQAGAMAAYLIQHPEYRPQAGREYR